MSIAVRPGRRYLLGLITAALLVPLPSAAQRRIDLSRFVAVGDSLTAGVQDIGLEASRQRDGYAAVIARQARVAFPQPLISWPGAPYVLEVKKDGAIPEIGPVIAPNPNLPPLIVRLNPLVRPHNLAVPSYKLAEALNYRPNASQPLTIFDRGPWVLGMPTPYIIPSPLFCSGRPADPICIGDTMVEQAKAHRPTTTLVWIGNNDALIPALIDPGAVPLTPVESFRADFQKLLDELARPGNTLIVATIPFVTTIPYVSSISEVAAGYNMTAAQLGERIGTAPNDYVRRSALPIIDKIVTGEVPGPLPALCPKPIYPLPVPQVPCRLMAAQAQAIEERTRQYNDIIREITAQKGGLLVDAAALVSEIDQNGYMVGNQKLTTRFLGGLFSLDGIHPSTTGYAVIANYFIEKMNSAYGLNIPKVSIPNVWKNDPLAKYYRP